MTGALLFKNPRLLLLLIGVIAVAGLTSYTTLPRMEDPILVQRFGVIRTIFPGADAERVESQISRPLEEDIRKIKGIKEIRTDSMAGLSTVGIELKEDITDVDTVWSRVRDALSETAKRLPEGARQPDFKQPELRAYASILALKWTGSGEANYSILRRLTEDLKAEIRALSGTESVGLFGQPEEEILVEIPHDVLHRMGLTIGDISRQIRESEAKGSSGMLRSDDSELVIELDQDFDTLKRVGTTPIRYGEEGRLTSLEEIAEIQKTIENPPSNRAVVDGLDAVVTAAFVREESRIDLWT
ncbi:MAG: efflux RND transporter permease subunit, partial [Verrucomicrobiales bacterium]